MNRSLFLPLLVFVLAAYISSVQAELIEVMDKPGQVLEPMRLTEDQSASKQFGELFYQIQILQQEVMLLRGQVEEQSRQLNQVKQQNMTRVVNLDRRVSEITTILEGGEVNPKSSPVSTSIVSQTITAVPEIPAQEGEYQAYRACYDMVKRKKFDEAIVAFKQFQANFPEGRYVANSYYWLGELYLTPPPRDIELARQSFAFLLEHYPNHSKVSDTLYKLGKVHYLKGDMLKSREYLERVIREDSDTDSSAAKLAKVFLQDKF
tara:strand:+ start:1489 stop:2277 length:789 start_codon:yes stop_codon:yes gene_type:complete